MRIKQFALYLLFFSSFYSIMAQDMQQGFAYLESGNYKDAKVFFEKVLQEYPENKTAKLCYGRAVGLLGDSEEAIQIFTDLRSKYPDDFEIKLNYAESLLWDRQFEVAETFYEGLVQENPKSFAGVLGYANTLSNLKKYTKALEWVNKALQLSPGNANALTSRKFVRLGYAFTLSQNKQYTEALQLLDENLKDFPEDKDTLLNKANIFLITNQLTEAEQVYQQIATTPRDSIVAFNGLSLVANKQHKPKKALALVELSREKVASYKKDDPLWLATQERYVQALLWNQKYKKAKGELSNLKSGFPDNNKVSSLEATYGMYTSNFGISLDRYSAILSNEASSFDGNLGIANAYRASGNDMKAYEYAFKTLYYYPKQPDAEKLIKTLKISHTPFVEQKTAYTFDNGDNEAFSAGVAVEVPFSARFKTMFRYTYRKTENTRTEVEATSNDVSLGMSYKLSGRVSFLGNIGINNSEAITTDFTQLTAEAVVQTKPFKLQSLDVGYKRELQNFNADLINREIVMNNYFANYNLGTNFRLGWYTQYIYTTQTDDNVRNLLFTSLYYNVLKRPGVKVGANYQYISFKDQVPEIYFSPGTFHLGEVFAELVSNAENDLFYSLSAALGKQFVDDEDASTTFRAEGKLGYRFTDRFKANLYGKYSNIASATAAGFEFTEFGFVLKWYFLKKPLFDKNIMKLKKNSESDN